MSWNRTQSFSPKAKRPAFSIFACVMICPLLLVIEKSLHYVQENETESQ